MDILYVKEIREGWISRSMKNGLAVESSYVWIVVNDALLCGE